MMSRRRYEVGAVLLTIASTAALFYLPALAGFTATVLASVGWCLWLERHPSA
jgi:hypothetical protein